jgi:hypothetical protein
MVEYTSELGGRATASGGDTTAIVLARITFRPSLPLQDSKAEEAKA